MANYSDVFDLFGARYGVKKRSRSSIFGLLTGEASPAKDAAHQIAAKQTSEAVLEDFYMTAYDAYNAILKTKEATHAGEPQEEKEI